MEASPRKAVQEMTPLELFSELTSLSVTMSKGMDQAQADVCVPRHAALSVEILKRMGFTAS